MVTVIINGTINLTEFVQEAVKEELERSHLTMRDNEQVGLVSLSQSIASLERALVEHINADKREKPKHLPNNIVRQAFKPIRHGLVAPRAKNGRISYPPNPTMWTADQFEAVARRIMKGNASPRLIHVLKKIKWNCPSRLIICAHILRQTGMASDIGEQCSCSESNVYYARDKLATTKFPPFKDKWLK